MIVGVPLAYLAWPLLVVCPTRKPLLIYAACFALPALLWTAHARTLPLDPRLSFGIGEKLLDSRLLLDPQFYLLIARWSVENVLTWAGLPLFLLGLMPPKDERQSTKASKNTSRFVLRPRSFVANPWLPHFWLLGVLLFLLAGAAGVVGQDYYMLPLAGPAGMVHWAGDRPRAAVRCAAAATREPRCANSRVRLVGGAKCHAGRAAVSHR